MLQRYSVAPTVLFRIKVLKNLVSTNNCITFGPQFNSNTTMAKMTLKPAKAGTMKKKLEDILLDISWADISRTYFGKSNSWLYHKLDGVDGNKKPTDFTVEERQQLKGALYDLADRIRKAADTID